MLKNKIIYKLIVLIIPLILTGCLNQEENKIYNPNEKPLFLITDYGNTTDNIFLEIQNIDEKDINLHISFKFDYLNKNFIGDNPYSGGKTSNNNDPSGLYNDYKTIDKIINPHKIEKIICSIEQFPDYIFLSWDYDIDAEYN